jgi:CRP-like cAMP-binding protein
MALIKRRRQLVEAALMTRLAERAEKVSLSPGDVLFEQGQRDTPFYIVLSGAVDILDRQPDGDRYFTQCQLERSLSSGAIRASIG